MSQSHECDGQSWNQRFTGATMRVYEAYSSVCVPDSEFVVTPDATWDYRHCSFYSYHQGVITNGVSPENIPRIIRATFNGDEAVVADAWNTLHLFREIMRYF